MFFKKLSEIAVPALALTVAMSGGAQAGNLSVTNGSFDSFTGGHSGTLPSSRTRQPAATRSSRAGPSKTVRTAF